jgi:hypothetical protein
MQRGAIALLGRELTAGSRYQALRKGRSALALIATLVQWSFVALGFGIFLNESRSLLSDAQFTWGERQVMGIIAVVSLGGCGFAGWVVGRLIRLAGELIDVLADGAEAATRTSEMLERHVIPSLLRIASATERAAIERDEPTIQQRPTKS